jgi:flagellin
MSLLINYNAAAFNAHNNLAMTDRAQGVSVRRLSSGLRIASAADDPAAFVISENMRAQADGLDQAIRNANDGINLTKTAEAALNETHSLLRQMRTVAVHAANFGANSQAAIDADQAALDAAAGSIDRIASTTKFNGKSLLDGTYIDQIFQIGFNPNETATLNITTDNTNAGAALDAAGLGVNGLDLTAAAAAAITAIDNAITTISKVRANLGSLQTNTLETTVNSLTVAQENIRSSQSTIRDLDVSAEMVTFARNNIMLQAGTAMLAQANLQPQAVLQLLR